MHPPTPGRQSPAGRPSPDTTSTDRRSIAASPDINGKVFDPDPDPDDARPRLGATEIWHFDDDADHPIHEDVGMMANLRVVRTSSGDVRVRRHSAAR